MKTAHRYILEPYKGMNTRYRCPSCQQRDKTFSLYIDTETGEHIHPTVGRCNRESNCGNHYTPKQYFNDNDISFDKPHVKAYKPRPIIAYQKPISFINVEIFKASLKAYEANHFVNYLSDLFGVEVAGKLVSQFFIATSKYWNGATVFWQIDMKGKVRTGKIMLYSPTTGKRVKEPFNHIQWAHNAFKLPEFTLRQCFFGEHQLTGKTKPVAIVESEKTAIIASVYLPQFIWLACGSLTNLNAEKCSVLRGCAVTLFPDLNGFDKWSSKAKELSHLAKFTVSDLLERKATEAERKKGLDLADYLVKYNYKQFTPSPEPTAPEARAHPEQVATTADKVEKIKVFAPVEPANNYSTPQPPKHENWAHDIKELQQYFESITLPAYPVTFRQGETITNIPLFIDTHFATLEANNGKRSFLPYLYRMQQLKQYLTLNK